MTDGAFFVYGLLKPGASLHHIVRPYVVRSAPASVRGRLYDAGVPAARFDEEGRIDGVVLWLDPGRLAEATEVLDDAEDEGELYERVIVEVITPDGGVGAQAYAWLGTLDGCPHVGPAWPAADDPED